MRRLNQGHKRANKSNRTRWKQYWTERSSRGKGEKCRGQAHRSPAPKYVVSRTLNFSTRRSPHEIDAISRQLCDQIGSSRSKCGPRKFQDGHPERQSYHSHQVAY